MNQHSSVERLYNLLPAIYRIRDEAQGQPLRALLAIAAREMQVLEDDIDNLYENWFIETCDEWVVPYIGDLLDAQELYAQNSINYGQQQRRAYVANTIAYRRRKGTAPVLEQLTRDVTDWRARAVEFFQRLATTQNLNHLRPNNTTVNLNQSGQPEFLGTPFEQQVSYSINIGDALEGRGFHNIPNIGLYIWRLQSYPMEKATARMVEGGEVDGRYYFSCLGLEDFPLFNQPQTETDILHLAEEINVPAKLRIPPLKKEIENLLNKKESSNNIGYFDATPVLEVFVDGEESSIPPKEILIAPLKVEDNNDWMSVKWNDFDSNIRVAIDPESGRLAFPPSQLPSEVEVSYFYGFSGDIGGGSYQRNLSQESCVWEREIYQESLGRVIQNWNASVEVWKCLQQGNGVALGEIFVGDSVSLQDYGLNNRREAEGRDDEKLQVIVSDDGVITVKAGMVRDENDNPICLENDCQLDVSAFAGESLILFITHQPGLGLPDLRVVNHGAGDGWLCLGVALKEVFEKTESVISIPDNKTYFGDLTIVIPADKTLKFMAADGFRPHLLGNLYVQGITPFGNNTKNINNPGEFILEGLLIEGKLTVLPGSLRSLHINHCTLVPKEGGLRVATWEVVEDDDNNEISDDSWTLIAIAIYFINAIRSLIGKGTPGKSFNILLKIAIKQAQLVFSQFRELIQWRCVDEYPVADGCLQPGMKDSLNYQLDNSRLTISIYRSICGALHLAETVPTLLIEESIIDNNLGADTTADIEKLVAIDASGTAVEQLQSSTVFGTTKVRSLEASDSIFTGRVTTLRKQIGCMRFCYLPDGSQTPRRYLCQPDKALAEEFDISKLPSAITCLTINKIDSSHHQLISGTSGKGLFSYQINQDNQNQWQPINKGLDNFNITTLFYQEQEIYAGTIGGDVFRSQDNGNSWESINHKEEIEPKKATGTISSAGRIVKGNKTNFIQELKIGDIITANGQKRIVTQIDSNYFFCVNTPFEPSLDNVGFSISNLILNTDITAFAVHESTIFAATARGGVFGFLKEPDKPEEPEKWTAVNVGITNLNVTSLIAGEDGYIYAGTYGGIFRTRDPGEGWLAISFGLENLEITALTIDVTRQLFAGTSGGGVFRFDEYSNIWTAVNDGLSNSYITVMAASGQRCDGTVSSEGNKLNGENTNFTADFLGRSITATGQTRTVTKVVSTTEIIVDESFCPELPAETIYSYEKFLVVGTVGGSIFYSVNSGETWQQVNAGLSDTDVSDLVIIPSVEEAGSREQGAGGEERNNSDRAIFVGTTAGNILCLSDDMQTWKSLNSGLVNVEDKLRVLSKIQPRFTSKQYGNPAYAQLSQNCAVEIRTGAEDGSEMGVFSYLKQPQRQANLEASLKEYLRFGLKVGIFYET
ncbi:hypothetical protein Riv7116_5197 [Rivularia sp. PCC 7116]|uniref:hypothetical protein n=1 Tax=Rivularia sp. PCC 7116 TaxID=373994 RepID=UPI00029EF06C|nr:hypothetical protein [Rivularia sp. PCC 7116]AFY57593.1 hypothetical protein Riv7116_5197 [Rivularia sp. PCC 7116]